MKQKTPIVIITGYLGSGKTTLLRRFIDGLKRRVAIIINEFGEIGIDGRIIKGKDINMIELTGGCVCCSLTGEFEEAIREIREKVKPEMIIVETTGVAEPDALIYDVMERLDEIRLDVIITVVDSYGVLNYPEIGYTGRIQIEVADVLILNKIDLIENGNLNLLEEKLRKINNRAAVLRTSFCDIDVESVLGISEGRYIRHTDHGEGHFDSFWFKSKGLFSSEKFNEFVKNIPSEIYRAKGFVRLEDGGYLFNYVCGRWDMEPFENKETELVFIGRAPLSSREYILANLKGCEKQE